MTQKRGLTSSVLFAAIQRKVLNNQVIKEVFFRRLKKYGMQYLNGSIMRTALKLTNKGLLQKIGRGQYKITSEGRQAFKTMKP